MYKINTSFKACAWLFELMAYGKAVQKFLKNASI